MARFVFDGFDDPLALEAAGIAEVLLANDEFFLQNFGVVAQQIAASSPLITDVTDEDLLELREKLVCTVCVEEPTTTTPVYMECDAKEKQIFINPTVRFAFFI
jgi:hypothetical protein